MSKQPLVLKNIHKTIIKKDLFFIMLLIRQGVKIKLASIINYQHF